MNLLKTGAALAAVLSLSLPLAAQAVTRTVVVNQNNASANSIEIPNGGSQFNGGDELLFRVVNPTSNDVAFTIPSLGINYPVPASTERTFYVNGANIETPQLSYGVNDGNGGQLASGTLTDTDALAANSLASLINYNTNYTAENKAEPRYNSAAIERPTSYHRTERNYVRGQW